MEIRAHHLLCIQGFVGLGYSEGFVRHLSYVKDMLYSKDPVVRIVKGPDDICGHCPHLKEDYCSQYGNKVRSMDQAVLEKMGIENGTEMRFLKALDSINSALEKKGTIEGICNECGWREVCGLYKRFSSM